jgi:hypothetical protein
MFLTESVTPSVLYVDDTSEPGGAGASWESALRDLGDALAVAECSAGQAVEIRVAQGVYRPDRGTGAREGTFRLAGGAEVKGGYAGVGAPDPDQRDPLLYPTVLTGDLAGNDKPDFVNYAENSRHVVTRLSKPCRRYGYNRDPAMRNTCIVSTGWKPCYGIQPRAVSSASSTSLLILRVRLRAIGTSRPVLTLEMRSNERREDAMSRRRTRSMKRERELKGTLCGFVPFSPFLSPLDIHSAPP